MITNRQAEYRAYLTSPVWKAKREEALLFHGCVCNRCKEWGNDVHHKTYERVGGDELMEDLEVMCRECHEAHHEAERSTTREKGVRLIHRRAIYEKLTGKHAKALFEQFPEMDSNLYMAINFGPTEIADKAAQLLGCDYAYGKPPKIVSGKKYHAMDLEISYKGRAFYYDRTDGRWRRMKNFEELFNFLLTRT